MKRRVEPDDRHVKRLANDLSLLSLAPQSQTHKGSNDLNEDDMQGIKVQDKFLRIPDEVLSASAAQHVAPPPPEPKTQQLILYRPVQPPKPAADSDADESPDATPNRFPDDEAMQLE